MTDLRDLMLDAMADVEPRPGLVSDARSGGRRRLRRHRQVRVAVAATGALVAAVGVQQAAGGTGHRMSIVSASPGPSQPQDPRTALQLNCAAGASEAQVATGQFTTVQDTLLGDPVADCRATWLSFAAQHDATLPVPPLTAYASGGSSIDVAPTGWAVPSTWTALPASFRVDPARLELTQRLDDPVDGPSATCLTIDQVTAQAKQDLDELKLTGWVFDDPPADEEPTGATCFGADLGDDALPSIFLRPLPDRTTSPTPADREQRAFFADLHRDISHTCLSLSAARTVALRDREQTLPVVDQDAYPVDMLTVPGRRCSTVDVVLGGTENVVLRGSER